VTADHRDAGRIADAHRALEDRVEHRERQGVVGKVLRASCSQSSATRGTAASTLVRLTS
jgi:hypothetical protein